MATEYRVRNSSANTVVRIFNDETKAIEFRETNPDYFITVSTSNTP